MLSNSTWSPPIVTCRFGPQIIKRCIGLGWSGMGQGISQTGWVQFCLNLNSTQSVAIPNDVSSRIIKPEPSYFLFGPICFEVFFYFLFFMEISVRILDKNDRCCFLRILNFIFEWLKFIKSACEMSLLASKILKTSIFKMLHCNWAFVKSKRRQHLWRIHETPDKNSRNSYNKQAGEDLMSASTYANVRKSLFKVKCLQPP